MPSQDRHRQQKSTTNGEPLHQAVLRPRQRDNECRRLGLANASAVNDPLQFAVIPFERGMQLERNQYLLTNHLVQRVGTTNPTDRDRCTNRNDVAADDQTGKMRHPNERIVLVELDRKRSSEVLLDLATQVHEFVGA